MKLSDYVSAQLLDRGVGKWQTCKLLAWSLWAMLVKPGQFEHNGELIELETGNGTLRMMASSLAVGVTGVLLGFVAVLGTAFLLVLLVTLPVWAPLLYAKALVKAWQARRRRAKGLAEARAGLQPKT